MVLDLKNTYFKDMEEVKELSKYYRWNNKQIIKYGSNKKLLDSFRTLKELYG